MRFAAVVAAFAIAAAVLLAATAPPPPSATARISALTAPSTIVVGETISVRGAAWLDDDVRLERRFRVCDVETGVCRTTGWGSLQGPGAWAGFAGNFAGDAPGRYELTWTLHAPWGTDAARAAVRASAEVIVVAAPD